MLKHCYTQQ